VLICELKALGLMEALLAIEVPKLKPSACA
jgi:hypothetical protein